MLPVASYVQVDTDTDDFNCADSSISAPLAPQTDITSPTLSFHRSQSDDDITVHNYERSHCNLIGSDINCHMFRNPSVYYGVYKQDDVVGQYLAQRAALTDSVNGFQAPEPDYANTRAGYFFQGLPCRVDYESYTSRQEHQRWYPDPESIRHLHTLHSLLPHIQPERKLNALNGLQIDIIENQTRNIICHAVPKKMLVLFLGRQIVTRFLHTVQREDSRNWTGLPTRQVMILPYGAASAAALKILVSWMIRACKFATMYTMKQIRLPAHLFATCSLAQTMELLGLRKDAHRIDIAISQQFLKRPIHAVEVESLWKCLGESSKYSYACIKAASSQSWSAKMEKEFADLAVRCPELYARICDSDINDRHKPHFGREWFKKLGRSTGTSQDGYEGIATAVFTVTQPGSGHTSDIGTRAISSLDPSAPDFEPCGVRT
ncbi:hypothetical protein SVAN01_03845 [Stagonosporopsis vannaccii]|nr:hypothetical protein SVAN01_03845 [Stagonosporopsis vannaccii]